MKKSHVVLCTAFFLAVAVYAPLAELVGTPLALLFRYTLAMSILLRWFPQVWANIGRSSVTKWALAYCLLAGVSSLWSADMLVSALAFADLFLVTAAAVSIGATHSAHEIVRFLAKAGLLVLVASLIIMTVAPSSQLDEYGRPSWTGVFSNPNELGRQMILLAVFAGALAITQRRFLIAALGAAGLAVLTGSAQVIVVGGTALITLAATRFLGQVRRARGATTTLVLVWAFLGALLAYSERDSIFTALGKDPTITNRTAIWQSVANSLDGHWATGFGYANFWRDPVASSQIASSGGGFTAQQAHNSALELSAQTGILGVVIIVALLVKSLVSSLQRLPADPVGASALISFVLALTTYSITASVFGRSPEQIYWVALVALAVAVTGDPQSDEPTAAASPDMNRRVPRGGAGVRGHSLTDTPSNT